MLGKVQGNGLKIMEINWGDILVNEDYRLINQRNGLVKGRNKRVCLKGGANILIH